MYTEILTTSKTALFYISTDVPKYIPACSITDIVCGHEASAKRCCQYCGAGIDGTTCGQCGAPLGDSIAYSLRGIVRATIYLQSAYHILDLPKQFNMEVQYRHCGPPNRYHDDETIAKLCNCTIMQIRVPELVALTEGSVLTIEIIIECDIRFIYNQDMNL